MRRAAATALLAVVACGASPEVATIAGATPHAPSPAVPDGGALGDRNAPTAAVIEGTPDAEPAESPAPESLDALDGGAHAGLNLHAQRAPAVPDDGLTALGSGTPPAWPRGPTVEFGPAKTFPPVSGVERVIAGLRPAFRRCYARALQRDPNVAGPVTLEAKLGPKGEIVGVKTNGAKGLPAELLSCISAALTAASFGAPPGGSATLTMPLNLSR
jgi:hypothetical protein